MSDRPTKRDHRLHLVNTRALPAGNVDSSLPRMAPVAIERSGVRLAKTAP